LFASGKNKKIFEILGDFFEICPKPPKICYNKVNIPLAKEP